MKRFLLGLFAVVLSVSVISCTSKEEKVKEKLDYFEKNIVEAFMDENDAKGERLMEEFFEWYDGLDKEEMKIADEMLEESTLGLLLIGGLEEAFDEAFDEAFMDDDWSDDDWY